MKAVPAGEDIVRPSRSQGHLRLERRCKELPLLAMLTPFLDSQR